MFELSFGEKIVVDKVKSKSGKIQIFDKPVLKMNYEKAEQKYPRDVWMERYV